MRCSVIIPYSRPTVVNCKPDAANFKDFEVIVVEDGSSMQAGHDIELWTCIVRKPNSGPGRPVTTVGASKGDT